MKIYLPIGREKNICTTLTLAPEQKEVYEKKLTIYAAMWENSVGICKQGGDLLKPTCNRQMEGY